MEHGGDIIETNERRLAGRGFGQVGDVVNHWQGAQQFRLSDEFGHPCAAILVISLEVIAIKKRQRLTPNVIDFEDANVGLIHGDVLPFLEGDPIQLSRGKKYSILQHTAELEVRLDLGVVEIVFGLTHLLAVEIPIPRFKRESAMLSINGCLNILALVDRL